MRRSWWLGVLWISKSHLAKDGWLENERFLLLKFVILDDAKCSNGSPGAFSSAACACAGPQSPPIVAHSMPDSPPTLLYCRCAYAQVVPTGVKNEVLQKLCDSGASFETVSDLCEMAAHRDPRLKALASCGKLRIAACYPRAVKGLFQQADSPLSEDVEIHNMRTETADAVIEALLRADA